MDPQSPESRGHRLARFALLVLGAASAAAAGGYAVYLLQPDDPAAAATIGGLSAVAVVAAIAAGALGRRHAFALENAPRVIDAESGLGNRLYFSEASGREISRSRRHGNPCALAVFEVGVVNFSPGSPGEQPLPFGTYVARVVTDVARQSDVTFRLDDRLFATLLTECELDGARRFVERVRHEMSRQPYMRNADNSGAYVRAWGGVAEWQPEIENPQQFLDSALADLAIVRPGLQSEEARFRGTGGVRRAS